MPCSHGLVGGQPISCQHLTSSECATVTALTEIADEIRMLKNAVVDLKEVMMTHAS